MTSVLDNPDALVPPRFYTCPDYVETIGPEVADFGTLCGRTPNPEQRLLLDGAFGLTREGRLAAFEVYVIASRQNLKTGFLELQALGKAVLLKRPVQIWTAHKETATDEAFKDFMMMIESSAELSRRIKHIGNGKGNKSIDFMNGCTIIFRPRTVKAGQSMSADDVDLDELFAAEPAHIGSLIPTLSTRPLAQVTGASSAPHKKSAYLRAVMARGRAGVNEPRLLYAEWSIQQKLREDRDGKAIYGPPPCDDDRCSHMPGVKGCIADDRELIKISNPSVGRSSPPAIGWDFIQNERRMSEGALEEYFRERLGAGDEGSVASAETIFGAAETWTRGEVEGMPDEINAVGVAMSADRSWIGLTGSVVRAVVEDEEDELAESVLDLLVAPMLRTADPVEAIAELQRLQAQFDCTIVLDEHGPASSLTKDFDEADLVYEVSDLREYATACARFRDKVTAPETQIKHLANADFDAEVAEARWKWIGDNRVIARRDGNESRDVVFLEAAILAAHRAELVGAVPNAY